MSSDLAFADALRAGHATFGGWCVMPTAFSAEVLGQRGFDWVAIDWQHGFMGQETSANMIQVISLTGAAPLVRVGFNDPMVIMKALDMGATGVIVPLVNSGAEAATAVAACRYPPAGRRSYGPIRNAPVIGTEAGAANDRVVCIAMIETAEGYADLDEICGTPGLDGVFIGPDDLRLSLGISHDDLPAAFERIRSVCAEHGLASGVHAGDGESARRFAEQGFQLIGIASDADFLAGLAERELANAKGETAVAVGPTPTGVVRSVVWAGL